MRIRSLGFAAVLALVALPAAADGVAGKWNASVDTPQGPFQLVFDFAVDGDRLTGSMANDFMGATPISDGAVDGNALAFKLSFDAGPAGTMTISYEGVVDGDVMTLTSRFEGEVPGGGPAEQTFTATRVN